VLGFGFAYHGFPKLFSPDGHASFAGMLQGIGVPAADALAWFVGGIEFVGGLAIMVGAFTAIISAMGIVEMAVAMFLVHLPSGFGFMNITGVTETGPVFGMPGYEVNLLYIAGFLALLLGGAGALSFDGMRRERRVDTVRVTPPSETAIPDRSWSRSPEPVGRERR
jgi:putative oxidoreductase